MQALWLDPATNEQALKIGRGMQDCHQTHAGASCPAFASKLHYCEFKAVLRNCSMYVEGCTPLPCRSISVAGKWMRMWQSVQRLWASVLGICWMTFLERVDASLDRARALLKAARDPGFASGQPEAAPILAAAPVAGESLALGQWGPIALPEGAWS